MEPNEQVAKIQNAGECEKVIYFDEMAAFILCVMSSIVDDLDNNT